jgi:CubicO group peptidase (beta-lactamase class C family)
MTPIESHQQQPDQSQLLARADQLYEQYAKPLESEHEGEFVAIAKDGRIVLGRSAHEVGRKARDAFGPENFVFKIGPRVVGKWR